MSTSISKNINHPPSGFNPHTPDPASECIVIRGRSISAQSYSPAKKPENVKTTLVKCLLGDPENFELLLFYCFLLKKKNEQMCISEGLEEKKKKQSGNRSLLE